ncbi:4-hydroxybenzoate 3-monooxygenase [Vulcanimicrobium alpinum]|uniref:4-hydroxybenzoate 3-monooxygenase n=1 Tax=Vulcanimicrobium alpinum TaxID=3016050 RepID=A0AAN1XUL5_UNVUL|nr:4-hydroxybenzoate 3-monooxygenase [Vulcanimicrobium alpinum]BDE05305.1 4-hydroxybenzoate 3-monooxygenase [Vulcanimicrobium alpinum]
MSASERTRVAIVGAGPAGLTLAHLLHRAGIETIVLESRSRDYIEGRVRAGVLEHQTAQLLYEIGVGARMRREGLIHRGIELQFGDTRHRIDFEDLTNGKSVVVYGQQEVVKDLIAARLADGLGLHFSCEVTAIDPETGSAPGSRVRYRDDGGVERTIEADFIAGCDGFHGPARAAIPAAELNVYDHVFPFAWLGILATSPPVSEELIYANHERGFALISMRSRTVSRIYLQCGVDEDPATWPDDRIWSELRLRLAAGVGKEIVEGPIFQKGITPMRSYICAPMRYRRLFLAGDAAHIVPPTGAKGMNLAIADVRVLARAFARYFAAGSIDLLDAYSETCLDRIWKTQRFSAFMTRLLHRYDTYDPFERRLQRAEFDYLIGSRAAAESLAENYVGLPFAETAGSVT